MSKVWEIGLSPKQTKAWLHLEDPAKVEVFAGGGAGCFLKNTLVNTPKGLKRIQEIKVGDFVISFCDITQRQVVKKVVKTFNHAPPPTGWKCVHLKLNNGSEIKCTESHEFYIRGDWTAIGGVARGVVEARRRHERNLLHQQHGAVVKHELERVGQAGHNEARQGRKGVLQNHVEVWRQVQDHKGSQDSRTTLATQPRTTPAGKSYKLPTGRQQGREFGVVNTLRKCYSQLFSGQDTKTNLHQLCKGQPYRYVKTDGATSGGNSGEVQNERTHPQDVRSGIWGITIDHKGCNFETLEAREIDPLEIEQATFFTYYGTVYDLQVEDTHAYTVGHNRLIVHNSGKSWLGCLRQIYRRTTYANTRGFIGRRDFTALVDSTMKTYFALLEQMGYVSNVDYRYNAQQHTLTFANGSEQHFRHMSYQPSDPDYNRFGSTEYTDAFVDEAPEVDARACQVLLSRLRYGHQRHGITPEILYTGNPGEHWVKYAFVMDLHGKEVQLPAHRATVLFTIFDNPDTALKESYVRTLELLDDYDKARLLHGDWAAKKDVLRPFAHAFDPAKNVRAITYEPTRPLYISLDFNLDPFAFIYANVHGKRVHIFGEETIPSGTLDEACDRILSRFGRQGLALATVTGDYNGTARQMLDPAKASLYRNLQKKLGLSDTQLDLKPNPRHVNSRHDVNWALRNLDFIIDPSCVNTLRDFRTVEVDADGSIIKADRKQAAQRADHLDAVRYLVNSKAVRSLISL